MGWLRLRKENERDFYENCLLEERESLSTVQTTVVIMHRSIRVELRMRVLDKSYSNRRMFTVESGVFPCSYSHDCYMYSDRIERRFVLFETAGGDTENRWGMRTSPRHAQTQPKIMKDDIHREITCLVESI